MDADARNKMAKLNKEAKARASGKKRSLKRDQAERYHID
jgi:hypothetical protein